MKLSSWLWVNYYFSFLPFDPQLEDDFIRAITWFPLTCFHPPGTCFFLLPPWFRAWRLHCESRNQGKGMLEVPWLAVEPREWFASTRSTFQCRESWFNLRNFQSLPVVLLAATNQSLKKKNAAKSWDHWKDEVNFVFNPAATIFFLILLSGGGLNQGS